MEGSGGGRSLYASAEEAAIGDIPPSQARVVAKCEWNGYAVVLLETNDRTPFEPYQEVCEQTSKGWIPVAGGNGPGWTALFERQTGVFSFWDIDQPGTSVRIRYREAEYEVPVVDGYFLFCAWDVPEEASEEWAHIIHQSAD